MMDCGYKLHIRWWMRDLTTHKRQVTNLSWYTNNRFNVGIVDCFTIKNQSRKSYTESKFINEFFNWIQIVHFLWLLNRSLQTIFYFNNTSFCKTNWTNLERNSVYVISIWKKSKFNDTIFATEGRVIQIKHRVVIMRYNLKKSSPFLNMRYNLFTYRNIRSLDC